MDLNGIDNLLMEKNAPGKSSKKKFNTAQSISFKQL